MLKKYVMIVAVLLVILMFISTSTASVVSYGERYEMLREKLQRSPVTKSIYDTLSQKLFQVSSGGDGVPDDGDYDDGNDGDDGDDGDYDDGNDGDDGDDGDYDDGKHDGDNPDDGSKEDVLLPKIWGPGVNITLDDGNESADEASNTIDHPDGDDGGVVWNNGTVDLDGDEWTVDSDGGEGAASNGTTTVDKGGWTVKNEWTVKYDGEGGKLERIIEVYDGINNGNEGIGTFLKTVVENTVATDENGISSPGSGDSAENNQAEVVVITNDG